MSWNIEIPPETETKLQAEAAERGTPLLDYTISKLNAPPLPREEPKPEAETPRPETAGEAILRISRETFGTLSKEDFALWPHDFAINHNHYIHGSPKVEE